MTGHLESLFKTRGEIMFLKTVSIPCFVFSTWYDFLYDVISFTYNNAMMV